MTLPITASIEVEAEPNRILRRQTTMTLVYGDYVEQGTRCMLRAPDNLLLRMRRQFRFGIRLDTSWPTDRTYNHIIAQWRSEGSPSISLTVDGGVWNVRQFGESIYSAPLSVGIWYLWEFDIRFGVDKGPDRGILHVTLNRTPVYGMDPIRTIKPGTEDKASEYSLGIYRPWWNENPLAEGEPNFRTLELEQ